MQIIAICTILSLLSLTQQWKSSALTTIPTDRQQQWHFCPPAANTLHSHQSQPINYIGITTSQQIKRSGIPISQPIKCTDIIVAQEKGMMGRWLKRDTIPAHGEATCELDSRRSWLGWSGAESAAQLCPRGWPLGVCLWSRCTGSPTHSLPTARPEMRPPVI